MSTTPTPAAVALADQLTAVLRALNVFAAPAALHAQRTRDIAAARQIVADVEHIVDACARTLDLSGMNPAWRDDAGDGLHVALSALCDLFELDAWLEENDPAVADHYAALGHDLARAAVDPAFDRSLRDDLEVRRFAESLHRDLATVAMQQRWAERYPEGGR
jgi:hypothetical protein